MPENNAATNSTIIRAVRAEADTLGQNELFKAAANKSVLITGASGMVGSYLALAFLAANNYHNLGMKIHGLSRNMDRAADLYAGTGLLPISRDVAAPLHDLPRFDYLVHGASPVGPALFASRPAEVVAANLTGTVNLLQKAVRDESQRFLFVSTHEVYGRGKEEWHEDDAGIVDFLSPRACYPESKRAGENACVCFHRQYGLHTTIARLARIIGPNMNLDSGLFVCDFIKDGLHRRPISIKGDANLLRPVLYMADAAAALLCVLFKGEAGQAYNVAPVETMTIRETAEEIARLSGMTIREVSPGGPGGGAVQNIDKVRRLGWMPKVSTREGIGGTWAINYVI